MENKLTQSERQKVLTMYLGCDCLIGDKDWKRPEISPIDLAPGIDLDYGKPIKTKISLHSIAIFWHQLWPILTPIAKITDEHAVELAKIASRQPSHYGAGYADITRYQNSIRVVFLDKMDEWVNINDEGDILVYEWLKNNQRIINMRPYGQSEYIDKMRELGYALPYKGIDLFKAGIAIEA